MLKCIQIGTGSLQQTADAASLQRFNSWSDNIFTAQQTKALKPDFKPENKHKGCGLQ